ncbi:hypothetical protein [Streptomyces sp. NPDC047974]|uniref:hypothetical protein n=1 Tax=Streptomyces sp. NPDC047974 TaxID=3154343 RepID=UPI0033D6CD6C
MVEEHLLFGGADQVLYYRLLEEAAAAGVTTLHYGLGSERAKRSRGCAVTEQRCHVLRLRTS